MPKTWSNQQQAIFDWFAQEQGNLIVRARAGTGKTTTIIEAINYAPEEKMLLCAFNKRIATELQQKLNNPRTEAKTLHALGFAFIRRAWKNVRLDDQVEWDRAQYVLGLGAPDDVVGLLKNLVSKVKNIAPFASEADVADLAEEWDLLPDEQIFDHKSFVVAAKRCVELAKEPDPDGRISFDDMLYIPVACRMIRPWYQLVVVDEAQDMNMCQLLIAQGACKRNGRIVVVGDDRQAIYGFRGADSGSIDRLKQELHAKELGLTITYRCGKAIVEEAKALVPDYQAHETAPKGVVDDCDRDALFKQAKPGDAILSRKNAPLMSICLRFLREGIPCRIEGRDVGAGIIALIKKLKARSVPDLISRLKSWGDKQTARVKRHDKGVETALQEIEDRVETIYALTEGAASIQEVISRISALFEDSDRSRRPAVVCSSVHKAKGLEWDRVFILHSTLVGNGKQEESNIEYVAITRAKRHLTWVVD